MFIHYLDFPFLKFDMEQGVFQLIKGGKENSQLPMMKNLTIKIEINHDVPLKIL